MRSNSEISSKSALTLLVAVFLLAASGLYADLYAENNGDDALHLKNGRANLEKNNYDQAVSELTAALEKLPLLGDYALLWRASAFEGKDNIDAALSDISLLKDRHRDSPLLKAARAKEISLLKKKKDPKTAKAFQEYLSDYPSDTALKLQYADHLKQNGEKEHAKKLFLQIYIAAAGYSKNALESLSPSDITAEDLFKRCENLKKSWYFEESERCFKDVLQKDTAKKLNRDATDGLAYSLFRQKRYGEALKIYKENGNRYWRARTAFRTGDFETLSSDLNSLFKSGDNKAGQLVLAYAASKRRAGDSEGSLKLLNEALVYFPSMKEDTLWAKAWTYYRNKDCKNASEIFSQLHKSYGESKYLYWKNRCSENQESGDPSKNQKARYRDFYAYLLDLKKNKKPEAIEKEAVKVAISSSASERIDTLTRLGFTNEATGELLHLSRKNPDSSILIYTSSYLAKLGSYKASVGLISKVPYNQDLHRLYYPLAYWQELEEEGRTNEIDPLLVLSVMREESRYDNEARSIAGALGLLQLMPQTAQRVGKSLKVSLKHNNDLYNPKTNIAIGSRYLKSLVQRFGSLPAAIAAYNAGEEAVSGWLKKGGYNGIDEFMEDIPYDETRNYVKRVLTTYFEYMRLRDTDISAVSKNMGKL
ncbi:MAG: lytic transglycosylase domain-containing protein [Nitrospirae bacterium]|nr:MAG: lytic transglycosylase domain-containing protein [Nitrospirota bacterium]